MSEAVDTYWRERGQAEAALFNNFFDEHGDPDFWSDETKLAYSAAVAETAAEWRARHPNAV